MNRDFTRLLKRFHPEGIPWPGSVFYNALSGTQIFLRQYELVAQDLARSGPARRVLDIGTGPARLLTALRRTLPDAELFGVDISRAMVAQAARNMRMCCRDSRISVGVADADALPFADSTFDCVVSTGSLHHWKNQLLALSEIYRVLETDGCALLYDLVRDTPQQVRKDLEAQFGAFKPALILLHSFEEPFLNAEEMASLGRQTDFTTEGTRFVGAFCCLVLRKVRHPDEGANTAQRTGHV